MIRCFKAVQNLVDSKGKENLTNNQKQGLHQLKQRIKANEVVVFPTDKSGRFSAHTPENYIQSMQKYIRGMKEVALNDYEPE